MDLKTELRNLTQQLKDMKVRNTDQAKAQRSLQMVGYVGMLCYVLFCVVVFSCGVRWLGYIMYILLSPFIDAN